MANVSRAIEAAARRSNAESPAKNGIAERVLRAIRLDIKCDATLRLDVLRVNQAPTRCKRQLGCNKPSCVVPSAVFRAETYILLLCWTISFRERPVQPQRAGSNANGSR